LATQFFGAKFYDLQIEQNQHRVSAINNLLVYLTVVSWHGLHAIADVQAIVVQSVRANDIKYFALVIYEFLYQARVFAPGHPLQTSQMVASNQGNQEPTRVKHLSDCPHTNI